VTVLLRAETPLPSLPSASGIEIVGPTAYVVSDDAPFLYLLDARTLASTGQVPLFDPADFGSGRIPKTLKPDLEAMTLLPGPAAEDDGASGLLLLGSGARPVREVGYFVPLTPGRPVRALALGALYAHLRAALPAGAVLNLEAAATSATELLLLQRPVGGGPAVVFGLNLADVAAYLWQPGRPVPALTRALPVALPTLDGYAAGFSGAQVVDNQLLVTASVEATADAVLDGPVLGSFVGRVDLGTGRADLIRLAWPNGRWYRGKVEGLAVRQQLGPDQYELLLVTDDDLGGSTAVVAEWRG